MHADESYYTDTYGGSAIASDDLTKALTIASEIVDELTHYQIDVLADLTVFQQAKIQTACCVIAEDAQANGCLTSGGVITGGFSLGDLTVQAPTGQRVVNGVPVSGRAMSLLRASGLMYGGMVGYAEAEL